MAKAVYFAIAGAGLYLASFAALLAMASGFFSPGLFLSCSPLVGVHGFGCTSSEPWVAVLLFVPFVDGTGFLFFGLFGWRFVAHPLFLVSLALLVLSTAGVTFGMLAQQLCKIYFCSPGYGFDARTWLAGMGTGLALVALQVLFRRDVRAVNHG
ncbi:MAG: hypothetical protein KGI38_10505 [Thaumarchaeota archaeon]|nr:hypothetical protein [Nitrososphaerota archaeon]